MSEKIVKNNLHQPDEEDENVVSLRLVTGGKGPPGSPWLVDLPDDTLFICSNDRKHSPSPLNEIYKKVGWSPRHSSIILVDNGGCFIYVDPVQFSKIKKLEEVIGVFADVNRSDIGGGLENSPTSEIISELLPQNE